MLEVIDGANNGGIYTKTPTGTLAGINPAAKVVFFTDGDLFVTSMS